MAGRIRFRVRKRGSVMRSRKRVLLLTFRPILGLLAVGSAIKQKRNVDVDIVILSDLHSGELSVSELEEHEIVEELKPYLDSDLLWVGITVFSSFIRSALVVSSIVKSYDRQLPLVWGGVHPTLYPEQPLESPNVDISVYGDGEATACDIVDAYRDGKPLSEIKGIAYRDGEDVVTNTPREYSDLKTVGIQEYSLIRNSPVLIERKYCFSRIIAVHVANGCPYRCSFCINTSQKRKHNRKDPAQVVDQVLYLVKRYGAEEIDFIDELFLTGKRWLEEFLRLLAKANVHIRWRANGHAKTISDTKRYPDDFFEFLRKSGLRMTTMGAESGSVRQLEIMNKGITPDEVVAAAKRIEEQKIYCGVTYMIGNPDEELADMCQTIGHIASVKKSGNDSCYFALQEYRPYPGNDMYESAVRAGFRAPATLDEWTRSISFCSGGYDTQIVFPWIDEKKKAVIVDAFNLSEYFNKRLNTMWRIPWAPEVYLDESSAKSKLEMYHRAGFVQR